MKILSLITLGNGVKLTFEVKQNNFNLYSGQRAESLQQLTRQVASLPNEFGGNSHTFKHHKSSGARITYRKY